MVVLRPEIFRGFDVLAGLSTRSSEDADNPRPMNLSFSVGDDPRIVLQNRRQFFGALGIDDAELAIPVQIHGKRILRVEAPGQYPDADGLMTSRPRVFLCISFADCLPVLLFDPISRSVAGLHAGWRGTIAQIAVDGVRRMAGEWGSTPRNLRVYVGPGAGACCYEVQEEVARLFGHYCIRAGTKVTVDLKRAILDQLLDAGCMKENIEISAACTIHEQMYHSHRRDGCRSGRMMACIGLSEGRQGNEH